ncbi:MAG: branched-chain amino acid ABC transporter permease [Candidatus Tectomicrobia bacterium]|nr:branched-chain amino acid ABC transporter permease [Candidatus Tectomicrobia bacterium]
MFLQQMINGLMLGSAYSLIAIGYTLIFGVLSLLHFAHGEVFMMGAFFGLYLVLLFKVNVYVALFGSMVITAILGILVERVAVRPISKEFHLAPLLSTVGVTIILQDAATKIFGGEQVGFPETIKIVNYPIGNVTVTSVQMLILATSLFLMLVLHLFVNRTRLGTAMRAAAESGRTASLLGVNINGVVILTFGVASALAGAAGVLVGLAFNAISPFMGVEMALKSFAIMLLGGLGNITGAMVGGLILGIVEVLSVAYLASSYRDAFAFGVMVMILIFRPSGLFGAKLHGD